MILNDFWKTDYLLWWEEYKETHEDDPDLFNSLAQKIQWSAWKASFLTNHEKFYV